MSSALGIIDSRELINIPLVRISPDPEQPRKSFDRNALEELKKSVSRHNLRTVLTVRPDPNKQDCFLIVRGERRWRALEAAGADQATCVVFNTGDPTRLQEEMLLDEHYQERLKPLERALAYQMIMRRNSWSADQLAANFPPLAADKIRKLVALLTLDPEVQALVQDRRVAVESAKDLLPLAPKKQREISARIIAEDLTVAAVKQIVKPLIPKRSTKSRKSAHSAVDVIHLSRRSKITVRGEADMGLVGRLKLLASALDNTMAEILAERQASDIRISNEHLAMIFKALSESTPALQSHAVEATTKLGRVLLALLFELRNVDDAEVRGEWITLLNEFPLEVKTAINSLRRKQS